MIEIEVRDFADPELARLADRCRDLSPALKGFGEFYLDKIDSQFKDERDPYGAAWTPLAAAYLARKVKQGRIPKILQSRGHMRTRASYSVSPSSISIGIGDKKAEWHDRGTSRLPRRTLFPDARGLPQDAVEELVESLADYLIS